MKEKLEETVRIEGMSCNHCVMAVKKALTAIRGVEPVRVEVGSAVVRFDPDVAGREAIDKAIVDAGFEVRR